MSGRDELALELFVGDNGNQPRETSIADWEHFLAEDKFHRGVEHYKALAEYALDAGFRKHRTITTVEELDALPNFAVVIDADMDVWQKRGAIWVTHETAYHDSNRLARYGPFTVLYEPEPQP